MASAIKYYLIFFRCIWSFFSGFISQNLQKLSDLGILELCIKQLFKVYWIFV